MEDFSIFFEELFIDRSSIKISFKRSHKTVKYSLVQRIICYERIQVFLELKAFD